MYPKPVHLYYFWIHYSYVTAHCSCRIAHRSLLIAYKNSFPRSTGPNRDKYASLRGVTSRGRCAKHPRMVVRDNWCEYNTINWWKWWQVTRVDTWLSSTYTYCRTERPTSKTAASLVSMPPNSSTKTIPSSGGRHEMGCANVDGASRMSDVVEQSEWTMSFHR